MASTGGVVAAGAFLLMLSTWPAHAAVPDPTVIQGETSDIPTALPKRPSQNVCQPEPGRGPEMVLLAPGTFQQGSPEKEGGRDSDESPQHSVTIHKPFAIGRCEVTVQQFRQFVEDTQYQTDAEKGEGCYVFDEQKKQWKQDSNRHWRKPGFEQTDHHPVSCVSWHDAQAYIQWLNTWLGLEGEWAYRLPTESEWEFSTRAGTTTAYYWGADSQCSYANGLDQTAQETRKFPADLSYADCPDGYVFTAPAGSFAPNRWGLYDASGNVWEWVQDCWVGNYQEPPTDGTARKVQEGETCERRSLRGGGWYIIPAGLRSAFRDWNQPVEAGFNSGFRLARTP